MGLVIRWILSAIALFITVKVGKAIGLDMDVAFGLAPFIAVLVLAVINALIRPILKLLTLPLGCMTFGLTGVLINALMFWLTGRIIGPPDFYVHGFPAPLFGSIVMGIVSGLLNFVVRRRE